ncbi:hypothetical protein WJX79_009645 [Trebouxia sp. C0005]
MMGLWSLLGLYSLDHGVLASGIAAQCGDDAAQCSAQRLSSLVVSTNCEGVVLTFSGCGEDDAQSAVNYITRSSTNPFIRPSSINA